RELYAADMTLAHQAIEREEFPRAAAMLKRHGTSSGYDTDLRGWEWHYLNARCRLEERAWVATNLRAVLSLSFDKDAQRVTAASPNRPILSWDIDGPTRGQIHYQTLAPLAAVWQGDFCAILEDPKSVRFRNGIDGPDVLAPLTLDQPARYIAWSRSGEVLAA